MILLLSEELCGTANTLMEIFKKRNIPAFRFNLDLFNEYKFIWEDGEFEITDPTGRKTHSRYITQVVCYKALISNYNLYSFEHDYDDAKWLKSCLNNLYFNIIKYAEEKNKLKLWQPLEERFPKVWQMRLAKRYFKVPSFSIFWGYQLSPKEVISKPLTSRPLDDGSLYFAQKVDRADLSTDYPWFLQDIAEGDRDATVVYINGKIHCYQFATKRGNLTDWRVTQGTDDNKWEKWETNRVFEQKIDEFMKAAGLKYGRLDFIIGGSEPQFLEVNPAGQFGWLDDDEFTLHNEVVDAILDESSTINL